MGSLDYFELSEKEALEFPGNIKGIVEIVLEDEYDESNYEEISHVVESSSFSFGDLQGEGFAIDNENKDVKGG